MAFRRHACRRDNFHAPALLGEHTEEILAESEIAEMKAAGVFEISTSV